jgi:hypothetical protein
MNPVERQMTFANGDPSSPPFKQGLSLKLNHQDTIFEVGSQEYHAQDEAPQ